PIALQPAGGRQLPEATFQALQVPIQERFGHGAANLSRKADRPAMYQRWAVLVEQPTSAATCSKGNPPHRWATITSRRSVARRTTAARRGSARARAGRSVAQVRRGPS